MKKAISICKEPFQVYSVLSWNEQKGPHGASTTFKHVVSSKDLDEGR